jgi:FtsH-binding integral membrane protein
MGSFTFLKTLFHLLSWQLKSLAILSIGTIVVWQFQYRETGKVYWRDRPLQEWGDAQFSPRSQVPHWNNEGFLSYPSQEGLRTASSRYWMANGGELVKVRLKHRAPGGLKDPGPGKGPPILVQIVGYTPENHPMIKSATTIAAIDPGESWNTTELVGRVPMEARTFRLIVISQSHGGDYQLAAIDAVEVRRPVWIIFAFALIASGWLAWIWISLRQKRREHARFSPSTLFASLWIFAWAVLLVFPRPTDHPRPFFKTFNTSSINQSAQAREWDASNATIPEKKTSELVRNSRIPASEKTRSSQGIQQWFKSLKGGRFFLHLTVMGIFSGTLLLLIPLKQALPAIVSITLGAELIPWILMGVADQKDIWDLIAYTLAIGAALSISRLLRRLISPRHWPPAVSRPS